MVGDGPARGSLERRLGPSARFVGYKSGEELADHYTAADIFAFASLTETFGNVVLEAMSSGLPVVAVRAGGVGETVRPGETGSLVDPSDPADRLAEELIRLCRPLRRSYADGRVGSAVRREPELGRDHGRSARALPRGRRRGEAGIEPRVEVPADPQAHHPTRRPILLR